MVQLGPPPLQQPRQEEYRRRSDSMSSDLMQLAQRAYKAQQRRTKIREMIPIVRSIQAQNQVDDENQALKDRQAEEVLLGKGDPYAAARDVLATLGPFLEKRYETQVREAGNQLGLSGEALAKYIGERPLFVPPPEKGWYGEGTALGHIKVDEVQDLARLKAAVGEAEEVLRTWTTSENPLDPRSPTSQAYLNWKNQGLDTQVFLDREERAKLNLRKAQEEFLYKAQKLGVAPGTPPPSVMENVTNFSRLIMDAIFPKREGDLYKGDILPVLDPTEALPGLLASLGGSQAMMKSGRVPFPASTEFWTGVGQQLRGWAPEWMGGGEEPRVAESPTEMLGQIIPTLAGALTEKQSNEFLHGPLGWTMAFPPGGQALAGGSAAFAAGLQRAQRGITTVARTSSALRKANNAADVRPPRVSVAERELRNKDLQNLRMKEELLAQDVVDTRLSKSARAKAKKQLKGIRTSIKQTERHLASVNPAGFPGEIYNPLFSAEAIQQTPGLFGFGVSRGVVSDGTILSGVVVNKRQIVVVHTPDGRIQPFYKYVSGYVPDGVPADTWLPFDGLVASAEGTGVPNVIRYAGQGELTNFGTVENRVISEALKQAERGFTAPISRTAPRAHDIIPMQNQIQVNRWLGVGDEIKDQGLHTAKGPYVPAGSKAPDYAFLDADAPVNLGSARMLEGIAGHPSVRLANEINPFGRPSERMLLLKQQVDETLRSGRIVDVHEATADAIRGTNTAMGSPEAKLPAPIAVRVGESTVDDPVAALVRVIDAPPEVKLTDALISKADGAMKRDGLELKLWYEQGQERLRAAGIGLRGPKDMQRMTREDGEVLFRVLQEDPGYLPEDLPANLRSIYDDIYRRNRLEEEEMWGYLNAEQRKAFLQHPHYSPRFWKYTKKDKDGRVEKPPLPGSQAFGKNQAFLKQRNKVQVGEMLERGFEPASWNPYDMVVFRRVQGLQYRQQKMIRDRLEILDLITGADEFASPQAMKQSGYRVPKVGPAFEGIQYPGMWRTPNDKRALAVPNKLADHLENMFPQRGSFAVPGTGLAVAGEYLQTATSGLKRLKLMASLFQHVDFATRGSGLIVAELMRGNLRPLAAAPSLFGRIAMGTVLKRNRRGIQERLASKEPMFPDFDINPSMLIEEGWSGGKDPTAFASQMRSLSEEIALEAGSGFTKRVRDRVSTINEFFESALFDVMYPETQLWALENAWIPYLRQKHPTYSPRQIAALAAREVNMNFSTIPAWQSVMTNPGMRTFARNIIFSPSETESWIRAAFSMVRKTSPHRDMWIRYHAGLFLFGGAIANVVNWASTGEALPFKSYLPVIIDEHGVRYNTHFLSPVLPWKGRNGTLLYGDVVGQADTALRWIVDAVPYSREEGLRIPFQEAFGARTNVLPRAGINFITGKNFYGEDNDTMLEKVRQAGKDLLVPISVGNLTDITVSKVPGLQAILPPNEPRLGTIGSAIQASGVNIRSEWTPDLLDRMAKESGLRDMEGNAITSWTVLGTSTVRVGGEPIDGKSAQDMILDANPDLKRELEQRRLDSVEKRVPQQMMMRDFDNVKQLRFDDETRLADAFKSGEITGKTLGDRYGNIVQKYIGMNEQLEIQYSQYLEDPNSPENANDLALMQWRRAYERARVPGGLDQNILNGELAYLETNVWTDSQKKYVDGATGRREHPPLIQERQEFFERYRDYWNIHRRLLNQDPNLIRMYEAAFQLDGTPKQVAMAFEPFLAEINTQVTQIRMAMRALDFELDAGLYKWGITQSLSDANAGRELELVPAMERLLTQATRR